MQGGALAVAVCNAGGPGPLPSAMLGSDALRDELMAITTQTGEPFNVNFFCYPLPKPDAAREAAWRLAMQLNAARYEAPKDTRKLMRFPQ